MADRKRVMSTSARWWAAGVSIAGVVLVVLSYLLADRASWWGDLLLNAGATVLLFVPLLYVAERIERRTEKRIAEVETNVTREVRSLAQSMNDVQSEVQGRLDDETTRMREDILALHHAPSQADVHAVLSRARELQLISAHGVRFEHRVSEMLLRFRLQEDRIDLVIDDFWHPQRFQYAWRSGESFADALLGLAAVAKASGAWPGDDRWIQATVLDELATLLDYLLKEWADGDADLRDVFQRIGPEWILADWALISEHEPRYIIALNRIDEDDWYRHVSTKTWVRDKDELNFALSTAKIVQHALFDK